MSDLIENIRRISNTAELEALIEQLLNQTQGIEEKQQILGDRSVAYQNSSGGVSQKASTPGTTETDDPGSDGSNPENGDGGGNDDGTGEDGDTQDATKDELDLQDLLDNGAQIGDKINSLLGLTDCGGGNEANIYLDGYDRPYDWGDAYDEYGVDEDPRESQFVQGTWYQYAGVGATNSTNPYSCIQAYLPTWDSLDPGNAPHTVVSVGAYDELVDGTAPVTVNRASGDFLVSATIFRSGCTVGVDAHCPTTAPTNQNPADGIHQLKFDGGQFQTSTFENDADINGPWGQNDGSGGPSAVSGCASGGETVTIAATGNGESSVTFGNGDVYTLDATGTVTGVP
jgi:hypothetical protein